jgi:hypothetical protein
MLSEDYLIRMINLAVAALLQIIGLKKAGDYQTALQVIDMTFELLLGLRASMVKALDDDRLYYLLTRDDQLDTRRLEIVADLFHEEGDVNTGLGRVQEARDDYTRALRYSLEVLFNLPENDLGELKQKIEALVQKLNLDDEAARASLGADTLWPLAGYYEDSGAFARAEAILLNLAARPEIRAEILPEVVGFYERLAAKKKEEIEKGGMTREQVQKGLKKMS